MYQSVRSPVVRSVIAISSLASILFLTGCVSASSSSPGNNNMLTPEEAAMMGAETTRTPGIMDIIQIALPALLILALIVLIVINQVKKRNDLANEHANAADGVDPNQKKKVKKYEAPRPELEVQSEFASHLKSGTEKTEEGQWALQIIQQGVQQGTLTETVLGEQKPSKRRFFARNPKTPPSE